MSLHEFYHLKALITLEQVDTIEWSKKIRILISKTAMVGYCKLSLYADGLVMNLLFFSAMIETTCHVNHFFNNNNNNEYLYRIALHCKSAVIKVVLS